MPRDAGVVPRSEQKGTSVSRTQTENDRGARALHHGDPRRIHRPKEKRVKIVQIKAQCARAKKTVIWANDANGGSRSGGLPVAGAMTLSLPRKFHGLSRRSPPRQHAPNELRLRACMAECVQVVRAIKMIRRIVRDLLSSKGRRGKENIDIPGLRAAGLIVALSAPLGCAEYMERRRR